MKLGELISRIERATGTSIQDRNLLTRDVHVQIDGDEAPITMVDVDGDVIVLAG